VPSGYESCHLAIGGGYVVVGHVPFEVINRLLAERPDVKGITLPGMPLGSPGMPGEKNGEWKIYAFKKRAGLALRRLLEFYSKSLGYFSKIVCGKARGELLRHVW
jgi:hypothetical protein